MMERVTSQAIDRYNEFKDGMRGDFVRRYKAQCLNPSSEDFNTNYNNGEHHYTLYYYDLSGNRVKTVPPEGVDILTQTQVGMVNLARKTNGLRVLPKHRMATVYNYNSLNQLVSQFNPDHVPFSKTKGKATTDNYSTRFWFDRLGRIGLAQNSRQYEMSPARYSYSIYDEFGRVTESGELEYNSPANNDLVNVVNFPNNLSSTHYEVTRSFYDKGLSSVSGQFVGGQQNVRNRVAAHAKYKIFIKDKTPDDAYDFATHYSYDIHGNVKMLIQDYAPLTGVGRFKKVEYDYDLISGKVNQVSYQKGTDEAFFHRYAYDEDNRITRTETSRDGVLWENDADYKYYRHGPLARAELGRMKVQGIDYAYTVQGWLKAINGKDQKATSDINNDGDPSVGSTFASDAFSSMLTYYGNIGISPTDYRGVSSTAQNRFTGTSPQSNSLAGNLYNGNIRGITVGFSDSLIVDSAKVPIFPFYRKLNMGTMYYEYGYDQLNRIKSMSANSGTDAALTAPTDWYKSRFYYDANGNITNLFRNGTSLGNTLVLTPYPHTTNTLLMDTLVYDYPKINGKITSNRLQDVVDKQSSKGVYPNDFDQNDTELISYQYDNVGNLITDKNDSVTVEWDNMGKIVKINSTRKVGGTDLEFAYDGMGNRVMKILKPRSGGVTSNENQWDYTYYFHDVTGNILATNEFTVRASSQGKYTETLSASEWNLFGSSRIGINKPQNYLKLGNAQFSSTTADATGRWVRGDDYTSKPVGGNINNKVGLLLSHNLGFKSYELINHLGNVMATITDRKINVTSIGFLAPVLSTTTTVLESAGSTLGGSSLGGGGLQGPTGPVTLYSFIPEFKTAQDYYPFGSIMPGRSFNSEQSRYGFNGQEKDDEVYGSGNLNTAQFWEYDTRLGRRWNIDPVVKPHESSYATFGNSPIHLIDHDGSDTSFADATARKDFKKALKKVDDKLNELDEKWKKLDSEWSALSETDKSKQADKFSDRIDALSHQELYFKEMKREFDYITSPNTIEFAYTSNTQGMSADEKGLTTAHVKYGSLNLPNGQGKIDIQIKAGYDQKVIHENRHAYRFATSSYGSYSGETVLSRETDAYIFERAFDPAAFQQVLSNSNKSGNPNFDIEDLVKILYKDLIQAEKK